MKTCKKNHAKIVYGGKGLCPYCFDVASRKAAENTYERLSRENSELLCKIGALKTMLATKQKVACGPIGPMKLRGQPVDMTFIDEKSGIDEKPSEPRDEILCDIHGQPVRFKASSADNPVEHSKKPLRCPCCGYFLVMKNFHSSVVKDELVHYVCLDPKCQYQFQSERGNPERSNP